MSFFHSSFSEPNFHRRFDLSSTIRPSPNFHRRFDLRQTSIDDWTFAKLSSTIGPAPNNRRLDLRQTSIDDWTFAKLSSTIFDKLSSTIRPLTKFHRRFDLRQTFIDDWTFA
jgi:hypothetical protein